MTLSLARLALPLSLLALASGCAADPTDDGGDDLDEEVETSESALQGQCQTVGATASGTDRRCSSRAYYTCKQLASGRWWILTSCGGSGGQYCTLNGARYSIGKTVRARYSVCSGAGANADYTCQGGGRWAIRCR